MARSATRNIRRTEDNTGGPDRYGFRITTKGAQHRGKRDGSWRVWGEGDIIDLTMEQFQGPNYRHLGLQGPLASTGGIIAPDLKSAMKLTDSGTDVNESANSLDPNKTKVTDATRTPDGTQVQDVVEDDDVDDDTTETEEDDDATEEDDAAKGPSKRKLTSLLKAVNDSSGSGEFAEARKKVIDAGFWEEDTIPTKKADLIAALEAARDAAE